MIPAAFTYHRPADVARAIELLEEFGDDAKLVSGGHSLIPTMKARMAQPKHLVDLGGIASMRGISVEGNHLRIGAATTHWEVESSATVKSVLPVLSEVAGIIADPQVRNRGTMGGSISNADPAADYPAGVLALEAELICIGRNGERTVKGTDWFEGLFTTALGENEILQAIRFPLLPPRTSAAYLKLPHPASRFAVVGVMAVLTVDERGRCGDVRIGVTGAGTYAVRARAVEDGLKGKTLSQSLIEQESQNAAEDVDLIEDMHFSAVDRKQLCCVYVKRALAKAWARCVDHKSI